MQIQRGFPAKVSDVRSTGTGLPTSSPGLQLSQGEKAVYQHTQPLACRAAALLTHTAPQLAQLSYRGNIFTVPNKKETNTPPSSCPLRGFIVHTEGFQTAHRSLTVREIPRQHLPPEELPLPQGNRTQHLSHRCAWPACEELRAAGHAPSHRPAKKPGVAGKSCRKQQLPQDREAGKGGSSLPIYAPTSTSAAAQPCRAGEPGDTQLCFPGLSAQGRTCQQITHQQKKASAFPSYQDEATLH